MKLFYRINWSETVLDGKFSMWINRKPVIEQTVSTTESCSGITGTYHVCTLGNVTDPESAATIFLAPNISFSNDNIPVQYDNYIKFGNYRGHHDTDHTIYMDNYRITEEFPPLEFETKLIKAYCNTTLDINDHSIQAYKVPDANNYVFEFKSDDAYLPNYNYVGSNSSVLNLNYVTFLKEGKTYDVRVRGRRLINGVDVFTNNNYGPVCTITIPVSSKSGSLAEFPINPGNAFLNTLKDELVKDQVKLFPNPVKDYVTISNLTGPVNFKLFALNGRLLFQKEILEGDTGVNLSSFPNGLYMVAIQSGNNVVCEKLLKE